MVALSVMLLLFGSWGFTQEEPSLAIVVPRGGRALVKAPGASIVGEFRASDVATVQLLEPYKASKTVALSTKEQKEDFPKEVRQTFPDKLLLERVQMIFERATGSRDTMVYTFSLADNCDLRTFWSSTPFRELLAVAYNSKVYAAVLTLEGRGRRNLPVSQKEFQQKSGTSFAFGVALQPGMNAFYLRALSADGRVLGTDSAAFYRATALQADPPPAGFAPEPVHTDSSERRCEPCHAMSLPATVAETKSSVEEQCGTCHAVLVDQKSSHAPAGTWDCLLCHDPSSSPKYQLYKDKQYDASLCFECHSDKQEDLSSKPVTHAPAASGECLTCHDPHGSGNLVLTVDNVATMCASCHEEIVRTPHPVVGHPLGGRPDPRDPAKELSCASCHNPHASPNTFLLNAPRMQLCTTCHQK